MKLKFCWVKRMSVVGLTVALMATLNLGLATTAFAESTQTVDLYTLIAQQYFAEDVNASGILTSGALKGNADVVLPVEGDDLIHFSSGLLSAEDVESGFEQSIWNPTTYTYGDVTGSFVNNTAYELRFEGAGEVVVTYLLSLEGLDFEALGLPCHVLQMPALLMDEARHQESILDRLVDENEPYMGYMAKMGKDTLRDLRIVLGLGANGKESLAFGALNEDSAKSAAIYDSFYEVINAIYKKCYNEAKELKIYRSALNYKDGGLEYYYQNSAEFQEQLDEFGKNLDQFVSNETRYNVEVGLETVDEVELTLDEKDAAVTIIMEWAVSKGYLTSGAELDFIDLQQKLNTVRQELTVPNAVIDVESDGLSSLVSFLETGGEVVSYEEDVVLCVEVAREFDFGTTDSAADYVICDISIQDGNGQELDAIPVEGFDAVVSMEYRTGWQNKVIFLAAYTEQGRCVSVTPLYVSEGVAAAEGVIAVSTSVANAKGNIAMIKAFVVDSLSNPIPVGIEACFPAQ